MKSLLFLKALLLACIALLPSCRILTNIPAVYGTVYVAISGTVWTAEGDYVGTASVTIPVVTNASVPYVITFTDEGILLEGGYGYGSSRIIPWYRGKPCS